MKITAQVRNRLGEHEVTSSTNGSPNSINIPSRASGYGSSVNGGEMLFLALATCYCNDIYREAAKRGITVQQVDVSVEGEFGGEGEPAKAVSYSARVTADASEEEIEDLMRHTDTVSEIQNTLRSSTPILLKTTEAQSNSSAR